MLRSTLRSFLQLQALISFNYSMPTYFLRSTTAFRTVLTLVRYQGDTWRSKSQEIACFDYYKIMRHVIIKISGVRIVRTISTVAVTLDKTHNTL
jgi:hypothetical protein